MKESIQFVNSFVFYTVYLTGGTLITEDGTVYVNGEELDEPYLDEKAFGDADIEMPYQVPDGTVFVMGDHRTTSVDSRHAIVGCVAQDQIVGKIIFRIWPLARISSF